MKTLILFITVLLLMVSCEKQESVIPGEVRYCIECNTPTVKYDPFCSSLDSCNMYQDSLRSIHGWDLTCYYKQQIKK